MIGPIRGIEAARRHKMDPIDVRAVVGALEISHLDPFLLVSSNPRGITIHSQGTARLDRQPDTPTAANLQVQVNGVDRGEGSSRAQVLVPFTAFQRANTHPEQVNANNHLSNVVRSTLLKSYDDGMSYTIETL